MKALLHVVARPLSTLFDMSLRQSKLLRDWKDSTVTLVFKTESRNLVSNYQPISPSSVVAKLLDDVYFKLRGRARPFIQRTTWF